MPDAYTPLLPNFPQHRARVSAATSQLLPPPPPPASFLNCRALKLLQQPLQSLPPLPQGVQQQMVCRVGVPPLNRQAGQPLLAW